MSDEKKYPNLKHFTSTNQPAVRGRKPSYLKKYIKDNNIGTQDIRLLMGTVLTKYKTLEQMRDALNDKDHPLPPIFLFPLKCLLKDFVNNKLDTYKFLITYAYGMPKIEVETKNETVTMEMNPEERKQRIDELLMKRKIEIDVDETEKP